MLFPTTTSSRGSNEFPAWNDSRIVYFLRATLSPFSLVCCRRFFCLFLARSVSYPLSLSFSLSHFDLRERRRLTRSALSASHPSTPSVEQPSLPQHTVLSYKSAICNFYAKSVKATYENPLRENVLFPIRRVMLPPSLFLSHGTLFWV